MKKTVDGAGLVLASLLLMGLAGCFNWVPKLPPLPTPPPPTTLATPSPTPSPPPTATPSPDPTPTATPTPPPPPPTPTPSPSPQPTPSPCVPVVQRQKVCVKQDGSTWPYKPGDDCSTCKDYMAWMHVSHNPRDGELPYYRPETTLVVNGVAMGVNPNPPDGPLGGAGDQCVRKDDCYRVPCDNPANRLFYDPNAFPRLEVREVVTPCATPTPPPPNPTPTPGSDGCPGLLKMGGSYLSAVDCGNCRKQGYLGWRVNVTSTELCREGDPGCVCDPARNRCEMPRQCQNPRGATVYLTLPGKFENDLCDQNSDNPFNCHHKPKADETGVTQFIHCPPGAAADDARCTRKCYDIQAGGVREAACPR